MEPLQQLAEEIRLEPEYIPMDEFLADLWVQSQVKKTIISGQISQFSPWFYPIPQGFHLCRPGTRLRLLQGQQNCELRVDFQPSSTILHHGEKSKCLSVN